MLKVLPWVVLVLAGNGRPISIGEVNTCVTRASISAKGWALSHLVTRGMTRKQVMHTLGQPDCEDQLGFGEFLGYSRYGLEVEFPCVGPEAGKAVLRRVDFPWATRWITVFDNPGPK
jgi:hypothetical protein